eukprot:s177_g12.t1
MNDYGLWGRQEGDALGVSFGDRFVQIGNFRVGDVDGTHFSVTHVGGKTMEIFRSDGTLHAGPRCFSSVPVESLGFATKQRTRRLSREGPCGGRNTHGRCGGQVQQAPWSTRILCVGDVITGVNDVTDPRGMLSEIGKKQRLKLKVRRGAAQKQRIAQGLLVFLD